MLVDTASSNSGLSSGAELTIAGGTITVVGGGIWGTYSDGYATHSATNRTGEFTHADGVSEWIWRSPDETGAYWSASDQPVHPVDG